MSLSISKLASPLLKRKAWLKKKKLSRLGSSAKALKPAKGQLPAAEMRWNAEKPATILRTERDVLIGPKRMG